MSTCGCSQKVVVPAFDPTRPNLGQRQTPIPAGLDLAPSSAFDGIGGPNAATEVDAPHNPGGTAAAPLAITISSGPDSLTIAPAGELDLATGGALEEVAVRQLRDSDRVLIVDLAGVSFCDSSGISSLVRLRRHCDRDHRQFKLTNLRANIHQVLVVFSGLGAYLGVQESGHTD